MSFEGRDRRQYVRVPLQRSIQYRLCYEKFANTLLDANASNLSQNGIAFKTKYPPPVSAVIALNIEIDKLRDYLIKEKLTDIVDPEKIFSRGDTIYGEVVRTIQESHSGFYSVAVKLVMKKDPNAQKIVEEARKKDHPQYKNPDLVEDEEKYGSVETPKRHPQYIDPSLAKEDE